MATSPEVATTDCPLCRGNAVATGRQQRKEGKVHLELECGDCHYLFDAWKRDWEDEGFIPPSP